MRGESEKGMMLVEDMRGPQVITCTYRTPYSTVPGVHSCISICDTVRRTVTCKRLGMGRDCTS